MQYRKLGASGIEVSALAFGAWQLGDPVYWGADAQADAQGAVNTALDAGITLFDTAESYGDGESERVLGKLLGSRRGDVHIATKFSPDVTRPEEIRARCEASLERLGTDYIDIYQIHWPLRDIPIADAAGELSRLREEGKIRHIGLSNYGHRDLQDWLAEGEAVSGQLAYNLLFRAIEYQTAPACRRNQVGILVYTPLMQGILSGRWSSLEHIPEARRRTRHFSLRRSGTRHGESGCERMLMKTLNRLTRLSKKIGVPMATMSLGWLLAQPGVTSVLVGARNPVQLKENLLAVEPVVTPAAVAILNEISVPLKRFLGPNCDMWQSADESRIR